MLNYQRLQIADMSGGITDNYKAVGKGKWKILKNLITTDNLSLKTRNGTSVFADCVVGNIYGIHQLNNRTIIVQSDSIKMLQGGRVISTAIASCSLNFGGNPVSISRYKNSALINGNNAPANPPTNPTEDKELLLATIKTSTDVYVRKASLPEVSASATTSGDRLLAVLVSRKYTDVDGFTFIDYGPEKIISWDGVSNISVSGFSPIEYTAVGVDTTRIFFYTTEANGTIFYKSSTEGTVDGNYTPSTASLNTGEVFAFEQEAIKRQAPICDYFTMAGGIGWYASINDTNGKRGSRAIHSVDGIPSSVIQSAYVDFDHPINGVGSINSIPIFLTDECLYRVDGNIGIDNSGFLRKVRVSNSEGGISHNSIIVANETMYYCGTDGIYATDGYTAKNITGPEFYKTYTSYTSVRSEWKNIIATFDRDNNIIYWRMSPTILFALELNTGSISLLEYPDTYDIKTVVSGSVYDTPLIGNTKEIEAYKDIPSITPYHRFVAYEVDSTRYLTVGTDVTINGYIGNIDRVFDRDAVLASGEYMFDGVDIFTPPANVYRNWIVVKYTYNAAIPVAIGAYAHRIYKYSLETKRRLLIGTQSQYLMASSIDDYSDAYIDAAIVSSPFDFVRKHIDIDLLSSGLSYGDSAVRKWVKDVTFALRSEFKSAVEPYVIIEDNESDEPMKRITTESLGSAYGNDEMVGSVTSMFMPRQVITGKRHIPKGMCRCRHNQIGLRSVITDLFSSNDFGKLLLTFFDESDATGYLEKLDYDSFEYVNVLFPYDIVGKSIILTYNDVLNTERSAELTISALSADRTTITFARPNSITPVLYADNFDYKYDWVIYGYRRDQRIELMSIDLSYAMLSNSANGFNPAQSVEGSNER